MTCLWWWTLSTLRCPYLFVKKMWSVCLQLLFLSVTNSYEHFILSTRWSTSFPMDAWLSTEFVCVCVCVCVHARAKSLQSCATLCNPMGCRRPGSSVHGVFQASILEWVALPSSRGSSNPGIEPAAHLFPVLAGGFFTSSATWEALSTEYIRIMKKNFISLDTSLIYNFGLVFKQCLPC